MPWAAGLVGLLLAACGAGAASVSVNGPSHPTSVPAASPSASDAGSTTAPTDAGGSTTTASTASGGTAASGTGTAPAGTIVSSGTTRPPTPSSSSSTSSTTTTTTAALKPPAGSGAYGYVTAGPTCPVEQAGQPCPPRPVSAEVDAHDGSGATVGSTRSDSSGRYAVSLPVGDYTLVVVTSSGFPRCPDTPIRVRAGAPTRADISCDTGIR